MGENSRVKKYEDLRNSLQQEQNDETIVQQALEGFDKVQNNEAKVEEYQPSHKKKSESEHLVEKTGEFKNEYLDNFIQEVREYNIKKGVRENDDTRLDILQQLSSKQRKKRASYMEQVDEQANVEIPVKQPDPFVSTTALEVENEDVMADTEIETPIKRPNPFISTIAPVAEPEDENVMANTQNIAKQVQELLSTKQDDETTIEPTAQEENPLDDTIQSLKTTNTSPNIYSDEDEHKENESDFDITTSFEEQELVNQQLLDETLKLRTQLNEYEEELTSLNDGVDKNNRLLNIVITVLIFMLFAVIIIVGYWLISGGIL